MRSGDEVTKKSAVRRGWLTLVWLLIVGAGSGLWGWRVAALSGVTYTVNSLADTPDANPGDGLCANTSGACTLRAAITEANATAAADTINFSVTGEIAILTALPDLEQSVTIEGPGARNLTILRPLTYTSWADPPFEQTFRIFNIPSSGLTIGIHKLKLQHGSSFGIGHGGNIFSRSSLTVTECEFTDGLSGAASTFEGGGAAIAVENANATIERSYFTGNIWRGSDTVKETIGTVLLLASNGGTPTWNIVNSTFINNDWGIPDTAVVNTGGGAIQVVSSNGSKPVNYVTNNTFWNGTEAPPLGSHTRGGGSESTTYIKNSVFINHWHGNRFTSTEDGALPERNQILSAGYNLTDYQYVRNSRLADNEFMNATGDQRVVGLGDFLLGGVDGTTPVTVLRFRPGSPALDKGTSDGAPATDARGVARGGSQGPVDIGAYESRRYTIALQGGANQEATIGSNFGQPLSVTVTANDPAEPINGGEITFVSPSSGPGLNVQSQKVTISDESATMNAATANFIAGNYAVTAQANGVSNAVNFNLTNTNAALVQSISRSGTNPTSSETLVYTVTFSESVSGVTTNNFEAVDMMAFDPPTDIVVTGVTGSGATRQVTVNRGSGTGMIALNMTNSTGVTDANGGGVVNVPYQQMPGAGYSIAPKVASITRDDGAANPPTSSTVVFKVTFSEQVSGVTAAHFTTTSGASITGVAAVEEESSGGLPPGGPPGMGGGGAPAKIWKVTVNTGTASTGIGISMVNGTGVIDTMMIPLTGLPFTTGETYFVPPQVVSIVRAGTNPSSGSSLIFTVTFNKSVNGGSTTNYGLSAEARGTNAMVTSVTGSGTTRTVTVNPDTASSTISLLMLNSDGLTDDDGASVGGLPFTTGEAYTIAPRVLSIARPCEVDFLGIPQCAEAEATGSSVSWTVTFNESVTGGTTSNFALVGSSVGTAAITGISGSGATRTVTANLGTASGSVSLSMIDGTGIADNDGQPIGGLPFSTGEAFTISPYVISVVRAGNSPSSSATVSWTVTFSSAMTGGAASNFALTGTGATGASITSVTGSGTTRTVTANVGTATASLGLSVVDSTGLADSSALPLGRLPFNTGEVFSIAPRVLSITRVGPNPPTGTTVDYLVTFSESVTGGDASNFGLTGGSLGTAAVTGVTGTGATRTVAVNLGTALGTIGLSM
ncbi:MAG: beta strand repeat-containing protein, partial [Blastocatellia bacterium]